MGKPKLRPSDWPVKVKIWECQARGDKVAATRREFELNEGQEGYPENAPDRNTIRDIRNQLFELTPEVVSTLPPEVRAFAISERPDLEGKLDLAQGDHSGRLSTEVHVWEQDPLVIKAMDQHYADLCALIRRWKDDWFDPNDAMLFPTDFTKDDTRIGWHRSGCLFWLLKHDGSLKVTFDIERDILFECLRMHLPDELWRDFDQVKQWLLDAIRQAGSSAEGHSDFALTVQTDRLVGAIKRQLDKALLKRVFPGRCPCCPG